MAFNYGSLPNNAKKVVNHNIANVRHPIYVALNFNQTVGGVITGGTLTGMNKITNLEFGPGVVSVEASGIDFSSYEAVAILKYTKTTD